MATDSQLPENESGRRATAIWLAYVWSFVGWLLVRCMDAANWVAQAFDPRTYLLHLRVRAISDGLSAKSSGRFAVLLIYCDGSLPAFTRTFIQAIERSSFNLIAVSNGDLDAASRAYLLEHSRLLIDRNNIGRDFGGYKDAIAILMQRFPHVSRLVLANDSVFYLPQGLNKLVAELDGDQEFIGVSEIFEHHYHVASFLISFGPAVLASLAFRRFWTRYRPFNSRRWAILQGEGVLTATLIAAGFQPHVLYRTGDLRRQLERCLPEHIIRDVQALPAKARSKIAQRRCEVAKADPARLTGEIIDVIQARNQMHYGGFLFRRHLGLPLVKRDLVYRGVYSLPDALANLGDLDPAWLDAVSADFRSRPSPASFGPLRRLLYRHGAI